MYHVTPLDIKKKYALLGHGIGKFGSLQDFIRAWGIVVDPKLTFWVGMRWVHMTRE